MKTCLDCKIEQPLSNYYKNNALADGLTIYCKKCAGERSISSRFKISREQYSSMIAGGCNACGSMVKLCIDHDHSCCPGQITCGNCIRGVLCGSCNTIEGHSKSREQLIGLLNYMDKHNAFDVAKDIVE